MRYVKTKKEHQCSVCKNIIPIDEEVIQSESNFGLFYHEDCHAERFGNSEFHKPKNKLKEREESSSS